MEDIYKNEYSVLHHAENVLSREDITPDKLREEYGILQEKYKSLLDLSIKLTKIGDRYQKKALDAKNALELSEKKLRELNATKDIFFSIIAHDLKNPLTIIMGFADLLTNSWDRIGEEDRRLQAEKIHEATVSLFKLLNNLLDWARLQTGSIRFKPEEQNIREIVNDTKAILEPGAQAKDIEILSQLEEDILIPMDHEMISTVIRNLISNAVKFTSQGGRITVSVSKDTEYAKITVTDTGKGMRDEDVEKLFRIDQHFSTNGTNNEKGTGLGLILCKEFIDKHNGTIRVESKPGEGSCFIISLPLNAGA
jgi:two-component system, sensor histidine kinase and response regulator